MMWNFKQHADHLAALTDQGDRLTYGQLDAAAGQLARQVGRRCLVFALCTNSFGSLVAYTGMITHRIVPLLLDSHLDQDLLRYLIDTYRPSYLWVPEAMTARFPTCRTIYRDFAYCLVDTGLDQPYPLADELALLLTTSGSTGSPKLVRLSYENLAANTGSIVTYLQLDASEKPITTLPMNYTYGLSIINSHLAVGATLLLTDKTLMEKGFWSFFKEQGATSFGGVPYTYEMLDKLRFFRMDLGSLRTMTQAGGKLSPELHRKFAEYAQAGGKRFIVMYGQTEATARMAYLPFEKSLEKCGSMGIAIPGGRFSLIDAEGGEIREPGVTGELVYWGPNVSLGYAEAGTDLSKGDENRGCLVTGDMAQVDADGYYTIVGRKKRFLKIFGNRVNLDETERMIKAQFADIECACAGVDDRMFIFIAPVRSTDEIRKFVSEKTGLNPVAFTVAAIDAIPKNESGKTLYRALEAYYN